MHGATDGEGNVLGWQVTEGQAGDVPQAAGLLAPWLAPALEVVCDGAYDSGALRALIAEAGATAVINPHPNRKEPLHFDPVAYEKRHHIEQTFSKIKQFRRLATCYDKLERTFDSFMCLRVITLCLN